MSIKNSKTYDEEIICENCLNEKNKKEKQEIEALEKQILFLEERIKTVDSDAAEIRKEIKNSDDLNFSDKEIELKQQIQKLETEQDKKKMDLKSLMEHVKFLEKQEEEYWEKLNDYERDLYLLEEKKSTYELISKKLECEITRLNCINVLNDVFYISAIDEVGTINGLKLGKLKSEPSVYWEDTNAALGQLALFFSFLLEKLKGLKYKKYFYL